VASASASPISISAALTGDPRLGVSFQDLRINVSIVGDTTSNVVNWLVDIASPLHPSAKLDEFYFNMVAPANLYSFSSFLPIDWAVNSPATTQGGGNITPTFLFETLDPSGPPDAADVTNTQNLSFVMTKSAGFFTAADFLNAATSCSNAVEPLGALGCGQLGAHLQGLGLDGETSGFLLGDFVDDTIRPPQEVPEPASVALVGLGLLALVASRRRKA
jgi:hypothetical protein